ncbi:Chloroplastic drought-induced stress protein of 32 kD [Hibiscus syriacus]|uniref:Chloroplastic drought-induced stress protein of 32 kD n=1 Tax=Hibiscus syriacus TaxID=106335 RepID=A0A6A2ZXV0_HIBSY|nr:Chloroplastic drought-induced stress protein of 32 kD [Hibiscus syriacus]
MIPAETRSKPKAETFEAQETTSPKVSCMGQIKHKNSIQKGKHVLPPNTKASSNPVSKISSSGEVNKHASKFRQFFSMPKPAKKPEHAPKLADTAPSLGQIRDYYSDDDEERRDSDFEQEDVIIPFSAPITVGGGGEPTLQPRKEINIWKRRTMNPARPLKLNPTATTN